MLRPAAVSLAALLAACAAPGTPAPEAEAPVMMEIMVPAEGPNGAPNTDEAWAAAAREIRADILARAEGTPEAEARFAQMMDCWRYVGDYGTRKFFDDADAGRPEDKVCDDRSRAAAGAFLTLADAALPLNENDRFQYFNAGLILDKEEFRAVGDAAAQRAYLQAKAEACFAAPNLPAELSAALLTDCPMAPEGEAIAK